MACCDYVVATADIRIALSEGKLGILPAVIGPYVYRRLGSATFRRLAMQASRSSREEALRIGFIEALVGGSEEVNATVDAMVAEVMTTGPSAVSLKELTLGFDRWAESDEALRHWTLDFTSRMRGSKKARKDCPPSSKSAHRTGSQKRTEHGGIRIKVLVANRGEIACRILRACKEAGHLTVAVYAQTTKEHVHRDGG